MIEVRAKRKRHGFRWFPYGVKMNKCAQTLEERNSVRILTNSTCLMDDSHLKNIDQKAQSVGKLKSISGSIGYDCYSLKGSLYKSVSKELKMKQRNLTPILMLQAGAIISDKHLVDQWHEDEETA